MRLFIRIKCYFEAKFIRLKESGYDYVRFDVGMNSSLLVLILLVLTFISVQRDVLDWNYLKGSEPSLSFLIGFFSVMFGVMFYKYWGLAGKSAHSLHFSKTRLLPDKANIIASVKDFSFAAGSHLTFKPVELASITRKLMSVAIFFNLALITLDNIGYDKLEALPAEMMATGTNFCPVEEEAEEEPPKDGCELIIRAFELGYAKDLGVCEPEEIDIQNLEVCQKRRVSEPFLHYMTRVMTTSVNSLVSILNMDTVNRVRQKFERQLENAEELRDYQAYAMSASPRSSHHIWTNLPHPENAVVRYYREVFEPSYCLARFQNQNNMVDIKDGDPRTDSKVMEHVYGQLLFNPKSKITVGFCKEFKIHWGAEIDICDQMASSPETILEQQGVLADVSLVLRRHDIANTIISLDEALLKIDKPKEPAPDAKSAKSTAIATALKDTAATTVSTTRLETPTTTAVTVPAETPTATAPTILGIKNAIKDAKTAAKTVADTAADTAAKATTITDTITAAIKDAITTVKTAFKTAVKTDAKTALKTAETIATTIAAKAKALDDKTKDKVETGKDGKENLQVRAKDALVSFQCFMQNEEPKSRTLEQSFKLKQTAFNLKTRYFPKLKGKGESQIAMYNDLAKLLEGSFHYSQFNSRSDIDLEDKQDGGGETAKKLADPNFLFSRLESLKNVDIFLGNDWILEREDLLGVYPYHVHLQNYVGSFRTAYRDNRGRL